MGKDFGNMYNKKRTPMQNFFKKPPVITNNKIILKDNSEGKMAKDLNTHFTE